jgi:hypothetical protein
MSLKENVFFWKEVLQLFCQTFQMCLNFIKITSSVVVLGSLMAFYLDDFRFALKKICN